MKSVPLVLEYEEILINKLDKAIFSKIDIDDIINYICKAGIIVTVFYLWRPFLADLEKAIDVAEFLEILRENEKEKRI